MAIIVIPDSQVRYFKKRQEVSVYDQLKKRVPTEHDEAVTFANWLRKRVDDKQIVCFTHIPLETYTTSWNAKRKNAQEGVTDGHPDYIVVTKKHVLYIELKRTKGSTVSANQKHWVSALNNTGRVIAKVCFGAEDAKAFVSTYL